MMISFTMILFLVYLALFVVDIALLLRKQRAAFGIITAVMVLGIVVLGYLWVASPM